MSFHRIDADPTRFTRLSNAPWSFYHPAFRVAPHVYYAGANCYVGAYLLDTGEGLALIDTTMQELIFLLYEGFQELGFSIRDLKTIFLTHIHGDHSGCARTLQERTGAKVYLSREDDAFFHQQPERAVNPDYIFHAFTPDAYYTPGQPIQIGRFTLHTCLTPGHTPGTTSFYFEDEDEATGRRYRCALHGGMGVGELSNSRLRAHGLGPEVRERFVADLDKLAQWPVDICLPSHPNQADLLSYVPADRMDFTPFVDSERWAQMLADCRQRVLAIAEQ